MIFIDRSIPRSVADALKAIGRTDVRWLEDEFPHGTPDEQWLAEIGDRGWLVISRDKRIRSRRGQRTVVVAHGVGMFIFTQANRDPTRWEYFKLMAKCLDEMERLFDVTERPFIYGIDASGNFRRLELPADA